MSYVADPLNTNKPEDTDYVGLATPAEIRAIKLRVNTAVAALEQAIIDMGNGVSQTGATNLATAVNNLSSTIGAIDTLLGTHLAATNPHGLTKASVGLNNVNNYPATSALDDNSTTKYLLAKAAYDLKVALDALATSTSSSLTSHDSRITTAQNSANSALSAIATLSQTFQDYQARSSNLVTYNSLASNTYSISNGSSALQPAYRNQLLPGIYTLYGIIYHGSPGGSVLSRVTETFIVTPDITYTGTREYAGSSMLATSIFHSYAANGSPEYEVSATPAFRLQVSSPTQFTFSGQSGVAIRSSTVSVTRTSAYCAIQRIMHTPL